MAAEMVCFTKEVYSDDLSEEMGYLKCTYGNPYNSFVFFKGIFSGDGWAYKADAISSAGLKDRVDESGGNFCSYLGCDSARN